MSNPLTAFKNVEHDSTKQELSVFKDPFQQNCIDEISIRYRRPIFATNYVWEARVDFKNGLTTGQQRTPDCESWDSLMLNLKAIYESLNVKPE